MKTTAHRLMMAAAGDSDAYWITVVDTPYAGGGNRANSVDVNANGEVYACGDWQVDSSNGGSFLMKFMYDGTVLVDSFRKETNYSSGYTGLCVRVTVDGTGDIQFVGGGFSGMYNQNLYRITGDVPNSNLWIAELDTATYNGQLKKVIPLPDGTAYTIADLGWTASDGTYYTAAAMNKIQSNTYTSIWRKNFTGSQGSAYGPVVMRDACVDASGNLCVATQLNSAAAFIAKLDSTGAIVWQKSYSFNGKVLDPSDIVADNLGNLYFAGTVASGNGNMGFQLVKLDSNGNIVWQKYYARDYSSQTGYTYITVAQALAFNDDYSTLYVGGGAIVFMVDPATGTGRNQLKLCSFGLTISDMKVKRGALHIAAQSPQHPNTVGNTQRSGVIIKLPADLSKVGTFQINDLTFDITQVAYGITTITGDTTSNVRTPVTINQTLGNGFSTFSQTRAQSPTTPTTNKAKVTI